MKNGLIYNLFRFILDNFKHLTLVEWFKFFGAKFNRDKNNAEKRITYSRVSVDVFIIFKWLLILMLSKLAMTNCFLTFLVWYLLITNVYSYFFYHVWTEEALNTENFPIHRTRRRFITMILAVGYSNLCFAYLYKLPYKANYEWMDGKITFVKSIWFSISNSLAANYEGVKPLTDLGNSVAMTQLIITFIFVTIILGKSIPQTNSNT